MAGKKAFGAWGLSGLLQIVAIVIFVLVAFGVDLGDFDRFELLALGLAFFAGGHVL
jgi:hypothetical protein